MGAEDKEFQMTVAVLRATLKLLTSGLNFLAACQDEPKAGPDQIGSKTQKLADTDGNTQAKEHIHDTTKSLGAYEHSS